MTNTILIQMSVDELETLIQCAIGKELAKYIQPEPENKTRKPLSQNEAARYFGKTRQTITEWRKKGILKGHNINGRIFFFQDELEEAIGKL